MLTPGRISRPVPVPALQRCDDHRDVLWDRVDSAWVRTSKSTGIPAPTLLGRAIDA